MFRNYLKTAWRSILKNKFFTFINLLCLSLGITFSLLIGMYVFSQYNVNSNLQNLDKQYILKSKWAKSDMGMSLTTLDALAKALKEEYPDLIQNYYRYNPVTNVVSAGETHLKSDIAIGDTTFVSMYGLSLLYGNPKNVFPNSNAAVISEDMAIKLYGTTNALNKRLSIQTLNEGFSQEYIVSGVLKKIPNNSVFNIIDENGYGVYVPTIGNQYYRNMVNPITSWNNASSIGFVELKDNVTVAKLDAAIKQLLKKYTPVDLQKNLTIETIPIKDYYLKDNNGAIQKMIWTLSIIAIFILLMAVFNFININIGTSTTRLKEVGVRKVFGSSKWQLVSYSLTESIMLTLISGIFSLFLYELLKSIFGQMLSVDLPSFWSFNAAQILFYLALLFIIGIASGLYPAFWISNINTVASVKGQFESVNSGSLLRRI
ncbi:MAG: hypothetical protein DI598_14290, partial [Pseudopedobacter saltans]